MNRTVLWLGFLLSACAPARLVDAPLPAAPKAIELPALHEERLPNGLTVIVLEDHELPAVTMTLLWGHGADSDAEPDDKAGLAALAATLLRQGTKTKSAVEIAEAIDFVGGSLEGTADVDSSRVGVQVLARDLDLGLALLADVATSPEFPQEEIDDFKRQTIAEIRQVYDDPGELGRRHLRRLIYGDEHPYSRFPTEASIASITRRDLVEWHSSRLRPDEATLAIAGDVTPAEIVPKVRDAFSGWTRGEAAPARIADAPQTKRRIRIVDKPDLTQSTIRVAHLGIRRRDPDYHAAVVANHILGGGTFSSRLLRVLRSEEGKTYGVGSGFTIHKGLGPFGVTTTTRTDETVATLDTVLAELEKMRASGVTPRELAAAKSHLVGIYPSHFETPEQVVGQVLAARLLDVPLVEVEQHRARVAALRIEDVNAAAKRRFRPAEAVVVIVGNAEEIRGALESKYGPVEVVKWTSEPKGNP